MKTSTGAWLGVLAMGAILTAACGTPTTGATTTASRTTPTVTANPIASPTPISPQMGQCKAPSNPCLALVTLRGSRNYIVRDLTDITHPKSIGDLGSAISSPTFISATELSYTVERNLYRVPLPGSEQTLVTSQGGAGVWSPDGSAVLYTTSAVDPETGMETVTVHQLMAGHDQALGSIPGAGAGGCATIESCQIPNFLDFRLLYSSDGTVISLVTTGFTGSHFRVWASNGTLLSSSDVQGRTMSAWSGSSLYFRDNRGVEVWHGGVVSPFLPGVMWVKPIGSPDGGHIVYVARDSSGWSHTYVVDTATKKVRELKRARSEPVVFLTSRFVWYEGERACLPSDVCGAHPPLHPSNGKTYIYDLQTGTEAESVITSVLDVWPHAA